MMGKKESESTREWTGFKPNRYILDFSVVVELPLRFLQKKDSALDDGAGTASKIGEVLATLEGEENIQIEGGFGDLEIKTNSKALRLGGPAFSLNILGFILRRIKQSQNPYNANFFWYASEHNSYEPDCSHQFFVVCKDAIVEECVTFISSQYSSFGFNPQAFKIAYEQGSPVWDHDDDRSEAETRYWYRKFYKETMTGQLLALRPDAPKLYYFPEGRIVVDADAEGETLPQVVESMRTELKSLSRSVGAIVWLLIGIAIILILKR